MTVRERINNLGGWKDGYCWFAGAWTTDKGRMPAFEVEWDVDGNAIHTGRRAWLNRNSIDQSQLVSESPSRYEPIRDRGERVLTDEEYLRLLRARNPGIEYALMAQEAEQAFDGNGYV